MEISNVESEETVKTLTQNQPVISPFFKKKKSPTNTSNNTKTNGKKRSINTKEDKSEQPIKPKGKRAKLNINKPLDTKTKYDKLTILDAQVQQLKLQNMDKMLMIQVGYKYKFFAEDAIKAANLLNFMLIEGKRNIRNNTVEDFKYKNFAYCSLPEQRVKFHLKKLLHYGYKVGIVKQFLVDGTTNKFERRLTYVYTRATYYLMNDDFEEDENEENQISDEKGTILAIDVKVKDDKRFFYLFSIELNTGNLIYDIFSENNFNNFFVSLETRLKHFDPSEVCLNSNNFKLLNKFIKISDSNIQVYEVKKISPQESGNIETIENADLKDCYNLMHSHLKTYSLEDILCKNLHKLKHILKKDSCPLSSNILKNLNFFDNQINENKNAKTVWGLLNNGNINTIYGKSILENWIKNPLTNIKLIEDRSNAINFLQKNEHNNVMFLENIMQFLNNYKNKNLLKTCNRLKLNVNNPINRRELYYYLESIAELRKIFNRHNEYIKNEIINPKGELSKVSAILSDIFIKINDLLTEKISIDYTIKMIKHNSIFEKNVETQVINFFDLKFYDNSSPIIHKMKEIDNIKEEMNDCLNEIKKQIGKPYLKFKDEINFLVEINNLSLKNIPKDWVVNSTTQLVTRYEIPLIKQKQENLKLNQLQLLQICQLEYKRFIAKINQDYNEMVQLITYLGTFDCIQCLAKSTKQFHCKPKFVQEAGIINFKSSHNPLMISDSNNNNNHLHIPNDIQLDSKNLFILTGPNSGGKTTLIKQVAYLAILAQIGCNTPCASHTQSIFTNFFIRTGSSDSLMSQKSTFLIEMEECQQILLHSDNRSLILMDEIGKGTSNLDGMAITFAILKYLMDSNDNGIVMFITHYHNIVEQFDPKYIYKMGYTKLKGSNNDIVFNYRLQKGTSGESLGINVAKLAGLPEDVLENIVEIRQNIDDNETVRQFYQCLKNQDTTTLKKLLNKQ